MKFILMPFIAWFASGFLKFCINYIRFGKKAKSLIGYGGFPSTHTTILSSVVFLVGLNDGFLSSTFSIGLGILVILIIDAHGLRRNVGRQAKVINQLSDNGEKCSGIILRERMGHTWFEILGGLGVGFILANLIFYNM